MSKDVYFYKVKKIKEQLDGVRNLDKDPFPENYFSVEESRADDWQKEIGQKCVVEYKTVDMFKAASQIFGKQVVSMTYNWNDGYDTCYDGERNVLGELTPKMLDPYRYVKQETVYVYECDKSLPSSNNAYCISPEEGIQTEESIIALMKECVEYDNYYSTIGEVLYCLTWALLAIRDGDMVVIEED